MEKKQLMSMDTIQKALAEIKSRSSDEEVAHALESDLRKNFIEFIAQGSYGDISEMAKEVLKSSDIIFTRWFS